MKTPRLFSISACVLAASAFAYIQSGCSKQAAPATTTASTPAPAAAAPAPAVAVATPAAPAAAPGALDFGDSTSSTLTTKAWTALTADKNYDQAIAYAQKCIDLYRPQALDQEKALTAPLTDKTQIQAQWALNDVGTCYFIQGQAYEKQNKNKEAVTAYQTLVSDLPFAQCWDPKGWFWPPAGAAKGRISALKLDSLN